MYLCLKLSKNKIKKRCEICCYFRTRVMIDSKCPYNAVKLIKKSKND